MSIYTGTAAASTSDLAELYELRYCYLCDEAGPHFSMQVGAELIFQCHACFATHADPLTAPLGWAVGSGRHRA